MLSWADDALLMSGNGRHRSSDDDDPYIDDDDTDDYDRLPGSRRGGGRDDYDRWQDRNKDRRRGRRERPSPTIYVKVGIG